MIESTKTVPLKAPAAFNDRTFNRLIAGLAALIIVGGATIAVIYWSDRHVEGGGAILDRTIAAAEQAVRVDPNKLSVRVTLAAAYAAVDRTDDAIKQYGVVLEAQPDYKVALVGRGDILRETGQLDMAALDYQKVVDTASQEETAGADRMLAAAYYGLGLIALAQDRPGDAAGHLASAVAINRADADALNALGTALIAINDLPNAVFALRDAVALVPYGWTEPYAQLEQAYNALNDADGATWARGMVALAEGRTGDALDLLTPLTGGPYRRDALIGLGLTAEQLSDTAAAADYYRQVYQDDPTDFAALTGLQRLGVAPEEP